MKRILLLLIVFFSTGTFAQCVIEINSSSCSGGNNALIEITSALPYDLYQWYSKPVGSTGDFQLINGATNSSLTIDWSTYDQTLLKVQCFFGGGLNYFSNTVQLDLSNCSLGMNENNLSELILFPNPVHDYLNLTGFDTLDQVQIFNAIGQRVFISVDPNLTKIDTSSLASGIYILRAVLGNNSQQIKFVKT